MTAGMVNWDDAVRVGRFGRPHGVRGLIRLLSYCEIRKDIANYCPLQTRPGRREITLSITRQTGDLLIAKVQGVTTRDAAKALTGQDVFAPRASFPPPGEDEYYHVDLIGLEVQDGHGVRLGEVVTIANYGATDLLVFKQANGETEMLPFQDDYVPEINIAGGYVRVDNNPPLHPDLPNPIDRETE
ncbi:MAG: ribosome maturation factor RimM [Rhodobacteraceae bacterium]|nr:ribosome maturation factor RimM [Paracoccaceae bacterium]